MLNHKSSWLLCASIIGLLALPCSAAETSSGEKLATTCTGCHGAQGNSGSPDFPNLAGQQAAYLVAQLKAFKEGRRKNSIMNAQAANLSQSDMEQLAAYFNSQQTQSAGGDAALSKQGSTLVSQCMGCHGEALKGNLHIPRLAGQQPDYLIRQLTAFKKGDRKGGPMPTVAAQFSEAEIQAIAAYLGSL
ncbi:c-type cytochrome [Methylicorpusculum sp.]|uniref:c-type cytochrome n=1 Tax=Methylicorpusculum sp. TaxID=2713644 RepID=UPI0027308E94|nr:c-type cytochrome [Methylicorpusculum sp.]MDP2179675.1 c-type cytochrome [Methylicorpusculum sp.]MDP3529074.1 c-type cytochrome [Methylicorpusculum sp.]MDZ4152485.1 c-type cytochrome [Methylicorpusculum sp.]